MAIGWLTLRRRMRTCLGHTRPMDETIDWLGHATVRIELDGIRILTDPTIRERIGPLDRKVAPIPHREVEAIDVVLISHLHQDHLDLPSLRRLGDASADRPGRLRRRSSGPPAIATSTSSSRASGRATAR